MLLILSEQKFGGWELWQVVSLPTVISPVPVIAAIVSSISVVTSVISAIAIRGTRRSISPRALPCWSFVVGLSRSPRILDRRLLLLLRLHAQLGEFTLNLLFLLQRVHWFCRSKWIGFRSFSGFLSCTLLLILLTCKLLLYLLLLLHCVHRLGPSEDASGRG